MTDALVIKNTNVVLDRRICGMRVAKLIPLLILASSCAMAEPALVLQGGTLIDLSDFGRSKRDIEDAVVVIRDGRIVAAGPRARTRVPADAEVIDTTGTFLVPGLNDVFATVNNQAQANAFLYMGVTGIVGLEDSGGRRGPLFLNASPGPRIDRFDVLMGIDVDAVSPEKLVSLSAFVELGRRMTDKELRAEIDRQAAAGTKVLLLYYSLTPHQVEVAARHARKRGLATIGELGATHYRDGIAAGVMAFVHTSRYSLDLAPQALRDAVAAEPFGRPRQDFYKFLLTLDGDDSAVKQHGRLLASGGTGLIPTLAMGYLDLPNHANPWLEPIAAILDPADIHLPADRDSGEQPIAPDAVGDGLPKGTMAHLELLERAYCRAGAKYLAGSGTDAFGTLPGISLHIELQRLIAACLTPRQALAAATSNVGALFEWKTVGKIAPGFDADLLILEADPTLDIANLKRIRQLLLHGKLIDRQKLMQR
jgi:Amidohydrolase family